MIKAFKVLDNIVRYIVISGSPIDEIIAMGVWLAVLIILGRMIDKKKFSP